MILSEPTLFFESGGGSIVNFEMNFGEIIYFTSPDPEYCT